MNTRSHPRTMEQAFGPYHRSSHGIEPMRGSRDYSSAWYVWMVVVGIVTVVLIVTTR